MHWQMCQRARRAGRDALIRAPLCTIMLHGACIPPSCSSMSCHQPSLKGINTNKQKEASKLIVARTDGHVLTTSMRVAHEAILARVFLLVFRVLAHRRAAWQA